MNPAVRAAFVAFTEPMEGLVRHLYADVKGLVTTGIGNLVDPMSAALDLPFRHPSGALASKDEIAAEWHRVKNDPNAAKMGHRYAARITTLRLTDQDVSELVLGKFAANNDYLRRRFKCTRHDDCKQNEQLAIADGFDSWPSDAVLATHSMAWACGPAFRFPRLEAALHARDWVTAAVECKMDETGNPGLKPRNRWNRILYCNAALAPDKERLYWPRDLSVDGVDTPLRDDEETKPRLEFDIVTKLPDTIIRCPICSQVGHFGDCDLPPAA